MAREGKLCEELLAAGLTGEQLTALRVGELPEGPLRTRCLELRAALGIGTGPTSPAFLLADGAPVTAGELTRWLRMARLIRTSLEANGGLCRSLLAFRHELAPDPEEVPS